MEAEATLDALPYVDVQIDQVPQMKEYVQHLIQEEMKTFKPRDYISHLPSPELTFAEHPMLRAEMERLEADGAAGRLDTCV